MEPPIISALISAAVSISVVAISRWAFSRNDRRYTILVIIQEKLLTLQADPPWDTSGGNIHFHRLPEIAKPLQPYFDRLRMVSFPKRECRVQKAWNKFKSIEEEEYKKARAKGAPQYDSMTKEEFKSEIDKILNKIKEA
ncbi:MAG: hypothetical protein LBK99_25880 [Opitutaceae bacterium]|jgi:hypothetical protein|nr:hypothetical protein [Opitutaceae bacterium]